jgi:hypothetical protein
MEARADIQRVQVSGALSALMDDLDDWCPTRPRGPFPPRGGLRDAMIAVAVYNLAEQVENAQIRQQLQSQAEQLYRAAGTSIAG